MGNLHRKPKVGLVVGSGGIKSLAVIPLIRYLKKAGIEPALIIACSGGAVAPAIWAAGLDVEHYYKNAGDLWTRSLFAKTDFRTLLSIAGLPFGRFGLENGMIKSEPIHDKYKSIWGDKKIEDLSPRMFFQTTDALNGHPVLLKKGLVREAVYASGSLFPMLPAIEIDGRFLIDGVYSSPLPIMEAIQEGMDVIIAMSFEELTEEPSKGFVPYFMRTSDYMQRWLRRNQTALSVDMHHHEIIFLNVIFDRYISIRSTRRIPQILEAGSKVVQEQKHEIEAAIESFSKLKK